MMGFNAALLPMELIKRLKFEGRSLTPTTSHEEEDGQEHEKDESRDTDAQSSTQCASEVGSL